MHKNHQHRVQADPREIAIQRGSETVWYGFNSLIAQLARSFGILDVKRMIGTGIRQMAMMFCRSGEVPLYESYAFISRGRTVPKNPEYHDFIMAILDISRASSTSPGVLTKILQVMRASIYILDPSDPSRTMDKTDDDWKAFLNYDPPTRTVQGVASGNSGVRVLRWVQDKFDAMGCTTAALRLISHEDKGVQANASALLATLLQGCNRRVQATILSYFYQVGSI